jgi:hypothetical protein
MTALERKGHDHELGRRVDALNLEPVVFKLTRPDSDEQPLTLDQAGQNIALYRYFLCLCGYYPTASIVPTRAIDRVWHTHLLDTAKYRSDSDLVFGRFLDHFPYAGLRGELDRLAWLDDFAMTRRLFTEHFGVEIGGDAAASVCRNHGDGSDCCVGWVPGHANSARPRPERLQVSADAPAFEGARLKSGSGDAAG